MEQPLEFTIDVRDFDIHLLAEDDREVGTDRFAQAVARYFVDQFSPLGGDVTMGIGDDEISVSWMPSDVSRNPMEYALSLLHEERYEEAAALLRILILARPDDDFILYNIGMAESDTGNFDAAIRYLTRATEIAQSNANAFVGLSVAYQRAGDTGAAIHALEKAIQIDPDNGHAHINLGAILGTEGRDEESRHHLREAIRLLPGNQRAAYGLAYSLEHYGDPKDLAEADRLYTEAIAIDPQSDIAELARRARSGLAQQSFRGNDVSPVRMDAVMYCLGALQKYAKMSRSEVQAVTFEIAMLGQKGINPNNPDIKYSLRSLPGEYSGLHLLSMMYVGFSQLAPDKDIGFDLFSEYAMARKMFVSDKSEA